MPVAATFPNGMYLKQIDGALDIVTRRRLVLADHPGSGKTAQALLAAELDGLFARPGRILIASTMTACQLTWARELELRLAGLDYMLADLTDTAGKKTMPALAARDARLAKVYFDAVDTNSTLIVLVNFEAMRIKRGEEAKLSTLFDIPFDMVIFDEAHYVLPTTEDTPAKLTQFWLGLHRLKLAENPILLPMTGTPDRGKLQNRYGYYKWFHPKGHNNFWGWARYFFEVRDIEVGYNPKTHKPMKIAEIGAVRRPPEWRTLDTQFMLRRTKSEMLEGMPPKVWADEGAVELRMTHEQNAAYRNFQDDLEDKVLAAVQDERLSEAQSLKLQFALRARQMATCTWEFTETEGEDGRMHTTGKPIRGGRELSSKLDWLLGWLEARGYTPDNWNAELGKVVVVSYFVEVLHWLKDELAAEGISAEVMSGDTPLAEKQRIEREFQRGDLRIVLLSGHIGVSINLDAADDMVFMDLVHDPDRIEQAEDRIHRASRFHVATYWRLASLGTIDQATIELIDGRYQATRLSYDGVRGVEFARKMLARTREDQHATA